MSAQPENIMPVHLRRLDATMTELCADVVDIKHRLIALGIQVGQQVSTEASHYASAAIRLDRIETRLGRLERQADIIPARRD